MSPRTEHTRSRQVFKNRFDEDEYGSNCEAAMLLVEEEEEHAQEEQRKLDAHIAGEKRKEAAKARAAEEDDALPVDGEQGGALSQDGNS